MPPLLVVQVSQMFAQLRSNKHPSLLEAIAHAIWTVTIYQKKSRRAYYRVLSPSDQYAAAMEGGRIVVDELQAYAKVAELRRLTTESALSTTSH